MSLNQRSEMDPRQAIRTLRIIWAVMLFSLGLYIVVLIQTHDNPSAPIDRTFQIGITLMGVVTGAVVLYLRFVRIAGLYHPVEPIEDKTLRAKIWANHIYCYVFSEATALFGFALAFLHGSPNFYVPLYLEGVLLMLACFPQLSETGSR